MFFPLSPLPRPARTRAFWPRSALIGAVLLLLLTVAPARVRAQTMMPMPGTFQFDSQFYVAEESDGFAIVVVSRVGGADGAFTLAFRTLDSTAMNGVDYQTISGTVTFANGDNESKLVFIPLIDDAVAEQPSLKSFTVILTSPDGAATLGSPARTTVTVRDDDSISPIQFATATFAAFESDPGNAVVTVTRNPGTSSFFDVGVRYRASDGTARAGVNYEPTSGTLFWAANDFTPKTFSVPLRRDGVPADNLTIQLELSRPSFSAGLGAPSRATLTLVDTDAPAVLQFSEPEYLVVENRAAAVLTVSRSGGVGNAVAVAFSTTADGSARAGARYQAVNGTVAWAAADSSVKSIVVPLVDDALPQRDETVILSLGLLQGNAVIGPRGRATLVLRDDEGGSNFPIVTVAATKPQASADGRERGVFTVLRTGDDLSRSVSVRYLVRGGAINGVEYRLLNGETIIPAGSSTAQIVVRARNGGGIDGRDNVKLILVEDGPYFVGAPSRAKVRIVAAP